MAVLRLSRCVAAIVLVSGIWCVSGTPSASADGTCSSVSYVNAAASGSGYLAYSFTLPKSDSIIGYDVHQNGSSEYVGEFLHYYSDSGSNRQDFVYFQADTSSTLTGYLLTQYC